MGFWNDGVRSRSRSRSRSPSRRSSHYASRPAYSRSASSFFSGLGGFAGGGGPSSSRGYGHSSRARPRSGFVNRIRRFLKEIYMWMRRHPVRTFMLVIVPLITGGALHKLLATVGIRLPAGLERMMGGQQMRTAERFYSRGGARDFGGGSALPGMGGGIGDSIGAIAGIAKMFI